MKLGRDKIDFGELVLEFQTTSRGVVYVFRYSDQHGAPRSVPGPSIPKTGCSLPRCSVEEAVAPHGFLISMKQ